MLIRNALERCTKSIVHFPRRDPDLEVYPEAIVDLEEVYPEKRDLDEEMEMIVDLDLEVEVDLGADPEMM